MEAAEGTSRDGNDPVLDALDRLLAVLDDVLTERGLIAERAALIRAQRADGVPWSAIVPDEIPPLIIERARESLADLVEAAGRLQRLEARALHLDGLTQERIGSLFGISRQRVAKLLHSADGDLDASGLPVSLKPTKPPISPRVTSPEGP